MGESCREKLLNKPRAICEGNIKVVCKIIICVGENWIRLQHQDGSVMTGHVRTAMNFRVRAQG